MCGSDHDSRRPAASGCNHGDAQGFARLDDEPFPDFAAGTVWLVGAGPGAPGLLTLLAFHGLKCADIVVYDALVSPAVLRWAGPQAVLEYAGKRGGKPSHNQRDISDRLVELARSGKKVLRLKGGDPFIFGRGGEECEALAAAGIRFRVVPGVTAGVGGLGYAGIAATHRDINHSVIFLTGHDSSGQVPARVDWAAVATASPVLVMYMAVKNLADIAQRLLENGRSSNDLVAVISNATLPNQQVVETRLGEVSGLAEAGTLATPSIVVVGAAADLRGKLEWFVGELKANTIG